MMSETIDSASVFLSILRNASPARIRAQFLLMRFSVAVWSTSGRFFTASLRSAKMRSSIFDTASRV